MKKIKIIFSAILLFLAVGCVYEMTGWINRIGLRSLTEVIEESNGGFIVDVIVTAAFIFAFYYIFKSSIKDNSYNELLKNVSESNRKNIADILYRISSISEIVAAVLAIIMIADNLLSSGFSWFLIYDTAIVVKIYVISVVLDILVYILDYDTYKKEKVLHVFVKKQIEKIKEAKNNENKDKERNNI